MGSEAVNQDLNVSGTSTQLLQYTVFHSLGDIPVSRVCDLLEPKFDVSKVTVL